jgi:Mrp family chromosome partitioning ATPase/capsular polysaccharide biosynthesis protein
MNETTDATSIFAPLWRRKWLILAVGIVVAAASYAYYKREQPTYQASTQIYLGAGSEEAQPDEKASTKAQGASVSEQVGVINSIVVEEVRKQLRKEHRAAVSRGTKVKAKAPEKGEFITITTEAHTAKSAALVANLTAQAFIRRQHANHQRAIEQAIGITRRQLRAVEAASAPKVQSKSAGSKGKSSGGSPNTTSILQAATLSTRINELEASLAVAGAQQIKPASANTAELLSPKPRKDAEFGFVLGVVLTAIAAYVLSRFDRRLRSLAGIEGVFQSQILAALPKVAHPIVHREGYPTPSKRLLEPLRRLHIALHLTEMPKREPESSRRVVLFVSPDEGDGKSTLVADLALIQRDAGQRVAIVEANFRRPVQAKLLGLDGAHGLAAVLTGALPVADAMQCVMPTHPSTGPDSAESAVAVASTAVESRAGSLFLLAGGDAVANPPALLAHETMTDLLRSVAADFDYVLIDAPSPLEVSDVMPILSLVDGIVIVARVGHTREVSAQRLVQLLARASSAPVLGVAANCVARADSERYGFSALSGRGWPGKLIGR